MTLANVISFTLTAIYCVVLMWFTWLVWEAASLHFTHDQQLVMVSALFVAWQVATNHSVIAWLWED